MLTDPDDLQPIHGIARLSALMIIIVTGVLCIRVCVEASAYLWYKQDIAAVNAQDIQKKIERQAKINAAADAPTPIPPTAAAAPPAPAPSGFNTYRDWRFATTLAMVLGMPISICFYLKWVHTAVSNARAINPTLMKTSPGMAVFWHFVPLVNLYKIFDIVSIAWHASLRKTFDAGYQPAIWVWWLGFCSNAIGRSFANRWMRSPDPAVVQQGALLSTAISLSLAAAGVGLILTIRHISDAQEHKRRA